MKYQASRGGHAPGHLREAFCEAVDAQAYNSLDGLFLAEDAIAFSDQKNQARWAGLDPQDRGKWLIGQLWNCTDVMPESVCSGLELPQGSTYAQGARKLKPTTLY